MNVTLEQLEKIAKNNGGWVLMSHVRDLMSNDESVIPAEDPWAKVESIWPYSDRRDGPEDGRCYFAAEVDGARAAVAAHHAQEIKTWELARDRAMDETRALTANLSAAEAQIRTLSQERDLLAEHVKKFCEAMEEETPEEALWILAWEHKRLMEACEAIKKGEDWEVKSYPSWNDRVLFVALKERAEKAEAQLANLTETLQINESQRQTIAQLQANNEARGEQYRAMLETLIAAGIPIGIPSDSLPPEWQVASLVVQTIEAQRQEVERLRAACELCADELMATLTHARTV